jgi:hypothetical protein
VNVELPYESSTKPALRAALLDEPAGPAASGRFVWAIALIVTLTAVYSAWCGTPMLYDGASQFAGTVYWQKPFVYLSRFHTYFLWQPVVWLSNVTENVNALVMTYGMPFLMAPVVGLLVSWWVVRHHAPGLILWAIFGTLAAPLPGQIFVINDTIFQQHLFWPIFLAMFVPLTWPKRVVLAVLVFFQFPHQVGAILLTGAAGAGAIVAMLERDRPRRRQALAKAGIVFALALLAWSKVYVTSVPGNPYYDPYAAEEMQRSSLAQRWSGGVAGLPLYGQIGMWLAAALAFFSARCFERGREATASGWRRAGRVLAAAAFVSALAGGAVWIRWASNERLWAWALEYRRWVVPLAMPYYLLAFLEACLYVRRRGRPDAAATSPASVAPGRVQLAFALAAVFAAVIGLQSVTWAALVRRLMNDVHNYPDAFVPTSHVKWALGTPASHWGPPSYVMVIQGKRPKKMLMGVDVTKEDLDILFLEGPSGSWVPLAHWFRLPATPGPTGWYDHRPIIQELRRGAAHEMRTMPAATTQPALPP